MIRTAKARYYRRLSFRCTECDVSLHKVPMAPMLHDEVWSQIAEQKETLCSECFYDRVDERGVKITLKSLRPCAFNLADHPLSWFAVFLEKEEAPFSDLNEWRQAFVGSLTNALKDDE